MSDARAAVTASSTPRRQPAPRPTHAMIRLPSPVPVGLESIRGLKSKPHTTYYDGAGPTWPQGKILRLAANDFAEAAGKLVRGGQLCTRIPSRKHESTKARKR